MALKGFNEDELFPLAEWCASRGMDLTFIEVMPMGDIGNENRLDQYWSMADLRARLAETLSASPIWRSRTGGPARYVRVEETGQKIGFITPLTHNFCESCNRVRLTCTGELFMCLGQEDRADLRAPLRASDRDDPVVERHPRRHRAQAQGPRFRLFPPAPRRPDVAPHEPYRRLTPVDGPGGPEAWGAVCPLTPREYFRKNEAPVVSFFHKYSRRRRLAGDRPGRCSRSRPGRSSRMIFAGGSRRQWAQSFGRWSCRNRSATPSPSGAMPWAVPFITWP